MRPSLPALLLILCATYLALRVTLLLHGHWWVAPAVVVSAVVVALGALVAPGSSGPRARGLLVLGAAVVVVAELRCVASLAEVERLAETLSAEPVSTIVLRPMGDATSRQSRFGRDSWSCRAEVLVGGRSLGRVWLSTSERVLGAEELKGVGRFQRTPEERLDQDRPRLMAGTVTLSTITERGERPWPLRVLMAVRERALDAIDPDSCPGAALVAGVVLGERTELEAQGIRDDFSLAGLAHLVAVSGSHLTVVCALVAGVLERRAWGPGGRTVALVLVSGVYVLVCGAPISAVRAWAMNGAAWSSALVRRRKDPLSALGATGIVLCLQDPSVACDLGFVLSAASVCALTMVGPWVRWAAGQLMGDGPGLLGRLRLRGFWRSATDSVAVALLCTLVTLPATSAAFGQLSLVGPLSNLLVAPLLEPLVGLGVLGSVVSLVPWVGGILAWVPLTLARLVGEGACWLAHGLGHLPMACIPLEMGEPWATLGPLVTMGLIWGFWPEVHGRPIRLALGVASALLAVAVVLGPVVQGARIVILDVGQGDAILVQDGYHRLLVDAGVDGATREALARVGVTRLDGIVVTHQHDDHYGGLGSLAGFTSVGELVVARGVAGSLCDGIEDACEAQAIPVHELSLGDVISVGRFRCEMVWPQEPVDGTENGHSICLRVTFEEGGNQLVALLTGDAERDQLGEVVGEVGDVDLIKVGHHGSAVSLTDDQADTLKAEVAVASAGEGNSYGHPTDECREVLEGSGAWFLCTKDVGDVEVRPGSRGPRVSLGRPASVAYD